MTHVGGVADATPITSVNYMQVYNGPMDFWGWHYSADIGDADAESIRDAVNVTNFARALVKAIDMVPYGEPRVVNFGSGDKAGFTLEQLIETSNICAHFVNELNEIYLDVFSCKNFDSKVVDRLIIEYFGTSNISSVVRLRRARRKNDK